MHAAPRPHCCHLLCCHCPLAVHRWEGLLRRSEHGLQGKRSTAAAPRRLLPPAAVLARWHAVWPGGLCMPWSEPAFWTAGSEPGAKPSFGYAGAPILLVPMGPNFGARSPAVYAAGVPDPKICCWRGRACFCAAGTLQEAGARQRP